MTIAIRDYSPALRPAWDEFVERHPHGSPFHLIAWKNCIEATFGYRPFYRAAFAGDTLRGLLPLFLNDNFITGKALLSTPFAVYGGILALDDEALRALAADARALGESLGVQYVELRNAFPDQCAGWSPVERYVSFSRPVEHRDPDALLAAIPKKTRNMIRKALKTPFEVRRVRSTRDFERLHSLTLRRLGTPSFPPRHFERLVGEFGGQVDVCEVRLEGVCVAASMCFLFRGEMHIYYAASDPRYNALAPNYRMYFDHLLYAAERGCRLFDFGRSKLGTGTFDFKSHWDTGQRPLPYEIALVRRKQLPNFSPANPKFDLAIRAWQRLPLPITRAIGPWFVRLFP